jgi:hypothetical protein
MRTSLALMAIGLLISPSVLSAQPVPFDASRLSPARDSFTVMLQGAPQGWQVSSIEKTPAGFVITERAELAGTATQTTIQLDGSLHVQSTKVEGTANGEAMGLQLTYADGRAKGGATVPSMAGMQSVTFDIETPGNIVDDNSLKLLVPALPLEPGAEFLIPILSPAANGVVQTKLTIGQAEQVTVPAGTFEVYPASLDGAGQPVTFYLTTAAPHRLVKLSIAGMIELVRENK